MDNFHITTTRFDSLVQLREIFASYAKQIKIPFSDKIPSSIPNSEGIITDMESEHAFKVMRSIGNEAVPSLHLHLFVKLSTPSSVLPYGGSKEGLDEQLSKYGYIGDISSGGKAVVNKNILVVMNRSTVETIAIDMASRTVELKIRKECGISLDNIADHFDCYEEALLLLKMLDGLRRLPVKDQSLRKMQLAVVNFHGLLKLFLPRSREASYLQAGLLKTLPNILTDKESLELSEVMVRAVNPFGRVELKPDAEWIVDITSWITHYVKDVDKKIQSAGSDEKVVEASADSNDSSSVLGQEKSEESKTLDKALELSKERNDYVLAMVQNLILNRLERKDTSHFDRFIGQRLKELFVPGQDVYSALFHYHSRLAQYIKGKEIVSQLVEDIGSILYIGAPKNYSKFDDKVDKDIRAMVSMLSTGQ